GALLLAAAPARAQLKDLSLDDIFDPEKKVDFGQPVTGLGWIDDAHYLWPKTDPKTQLTEQLRVDATAGSAVPLFDPAVLEAALRREAGVSDEQARRLARQHTYVMNQRRTALLVDADDDLFLFEFGSGALRRLTRTKGGEEVPSFSPDGAHVAFVRGGNL